jgi:phosphate transport system substrate-binding protein
MQRSFILHRKRLVGLIAAALAVSMSVATAIAVAAGSLTGAGSTLIAPLMAHWQTDFQQRTGISVSYGAVGSGAGIVDISSRTVNFGASDAPMTPAQAAACHGCTEIPWALTATAIGYRLDGVKGAVKLSGPVLAKIYLDQITNWDDPAIKKLNKHTSLPNLGITPVFRSDGSGDTYVITDFLSRVSPAFRSRVGNATAVSFPAGVGAAKNSGVAAKIAGVNGTVGYVAASYLITTQGIGVAALQNAAGNFEYPNLPNITAAAKSVSRVPSNNELHIVNPPSTYAAAYPMSTFTYAIVPNTSSTSSEMAQFIKYATSTGQSFGPALDFAALPKVVHNAALKAAKKLH